MMGAEDEEVNDVWRLLQNPRVAGLTHTEL